MGKSELCKPKQWQEVDLSSLWLVYSYYRDGYDGCQSLCLLYILFTQLIPLALFYFPQSKFLSVFCIDHTDLNVRSP